MSGVVCVVVVVIVLLIVILVFVYDNFIDVVLLVGEIVINFDIVVLIFSGEFIDFS